MHFLCYKHSIPMLYCYAYLRLSSSYAYYIWAKSPSVMAIPLVMFNIASIAMYFSSRCTYFIYFLPIPFHSQSITWWWAVAWGAGPFFLDPFLDRKPRPKEAKLEVLLSLESVRLNCLWKWAGMDMEAPRSRCWDELIEEQEESLESVLLR